MKIAITSPARRFESEIDDREGEALFRKIVGMIAEATIRKGSQPRPGGKARSMGGPAALQPQESAGDQQDPGADPEAAPAKKPKRTPLGAWGFVHIVCPACSETRTFNARNEIRSFKCKKCNTRTKLEPPLREAFTRCSCGKSATYRTNATESLIKIPCAACGKLITCEYNQKRGAFFGIQRQKKPAAPAVHDGERGSNPDLITTGQNGQK